MTRTKEMEGIYRPWDITPEIQLAREKRATLIEQGKHDRRTMIWKGIGWGGVFTLLAFVVLAGFWMLNDSAQQHGKDSVDIERARADQIGECNKLGEPLERQFCIMALSFPQLEEESSE